MAPYFSIVNFDFFCFTDVPSMNCPHLIILHPFTPVSSFFLEFQIWEKKKTPDCFFLYPFPNTEFMFWELDTFLGLKN